MNKEEIQEVLDELHNVNSEHLDEKGRRLFEAIMSIADERDIYKVRIDKAIEYIEARHIKAQVELTDREKHLLDILRGENNE